MGEDTIPAPDRYLDAVFGETGYLAGVFSGYRPRPGQVALAAAVDRAIVGKHHLLAEGPTGTGKSLAYAAPASYYAAKTGRPIVLVTANIALQEQIVGKDLPLLASIVPWKFSYSLMKGRNNYLCTDRYLDFRAGLTAAGWEGNAEERRQLPVVNEWAKSAVDFGPTEETGDVSELPFEPLHTVWRNFSVSSDECKKSRCRYKTHCFANAALARARSSHVIVTNYHMLYAHIGVFLQSGLDVVLPPFTHVILDEAHKAADIARDFFGDRVRRAAVHRLARRLGDKHHLLSQGMIDGSNRLFDALGGLRNSRERYKARLVGGYLPHEIAAWEALKGPLTSGFEIFHKRVSDLTLRAKMEPSDDVFDALGKAENDLDRADKMLRHLRVAMEEPNGGSAVFYLDEDEKKQIGVCSKLVHASDALRPGLFEKEIAWRDPGDPEGAVQRGGRVTVVATSATLATDGKGDDAFAYVAKELGVEDFETLTAESPFRWPEQCLFVVPADMPDPNAAEFREAVARTVERTILLAGGRTLSLHTSRRVLEHTYDAIVGTCRRQGITLLKQGDEPRTKLIARFKEDVRSVLLGTESFWAGVDVPGEACSVVIIDRLPFPTPEDPVLDVLSGVDKDWFWKYSVPRAMIAFKQGFGRLIRSTTCRGAVVCLDNRLLKKAYGKQFLRSLPDVPKSTRLDAIAEWLNPPAWDAV